MNKYVVTSETMSDLMQLLTESRPRDEAIILEVLNPDLFGDSHYNGERVEVAGITYLHRQLQTWFDLAQVTDHVLLTPQPSSESEHLLRLTFKPLRQSGWHQISRPSGDPEKYGSDSIFQRLKKSEEPFFWRDFHDALKWLGSSESGRVLSLGVNSGEELALCAMSHPTQHEVSASQWVGVDHSASAIHLAQQRFFEAGFDWRVGDLRRLDELNVGRFDLIMCLNTLQSPQLDSYQEIKRWVKDHLTHQGSLLLSFPNSRYVGVHQRFGTWAEQAGRPELSKLYKQIVGIQRYLHQHRFDVRVMGKYTVFIAARRRNTQSGQQ